MNKRCFVISPIGLEGSAIREHADDVFDYIIRPAMEQRGIEAFRSDHLLESGKISDQMFGAILNYDLSVAVLTGHNPNVFYEMAIAQCAARPVVMLIEKSQELPFDIRDQRCVRYTLKPRQLFEQVYVKEIIGHLDSLERDGWRCEVPFGLTVPLGGRGDREVKPRFFERAMDFGGQEDRLRLLEETEDIFEIMGMNQESWRRIRGFSDLIAKKAAAGCRVRVLLMHQDNPGLPQFVNEAMPEMDIEQVSFEIKNMANYFKKFASSCPNVEVRQLLKGCLHIQSSRTDRHAVVTQYLYSRKTGWSPLWQCDRDSPLYTLVTEEFSSLWKANDPQGAALNGQAVAGGEAPTHPTNGTARKRGRNRPS